jgi:polysaccharide deacetylase family protein (PEP-CTERM system associated)
MLEKNSNSIVNALTIDVEDWFHASVFNEKISQKQWDKCESRVVFNVDRILQILRARNVRATFFVLGWVAEKHPEVVQMIQEEGHELSTHGYAHKLIYKQTPKEFEEDVRTSIEIIEGQTGTRVVGYRAPSYSIIDRTFWAYEVIYDLGILYDSSIFPIKHDIYGVPFAPRFPYKIELDNGKEIYEFPLSTIIYFGKNFPIAGGGYFRLFPYWFIKWGIKKLNDSGKPVIIYFHPWELDPDFPRLRLGFTKNFRTYCNLILTEEKLKKLIKDFKFAPVCDVLKIDCLETSMTISEKLGTFSSEE